MHEVVIWHWETVLHDEVDVDLRGVEELGDVLVALLFVASCLVPGFYGVAVPLQHYEIRIKQQDDIVLHLLLVEGHRRGLNCFVVE